MPADEKKVAEFIFNLIEEIKSPKKITEIYYRESYQDYQVILGEHWHTELREKLIIDYFATNNPDLKREIVGRLQNPMKYEEWEDPSTPNKGDNEEGIVIDDEP